MTNEEGRKVCLKGWQVAGIQGAVEKGSAGLPNLDPFKEIDPITESLIDRESRAVSITKIHKSSKSTLAMKLTVARVIVMGNGLEKMRTLINLMEIETFSTILMTSKMMNKL